MKTHKSALLPAILCDVGPYSTRHGVSHGLLLPPPPTVGPRGNRLKKYKLVLNGCSFKLISEQRRGVGPAAQCGLLGADGGVRAGCWRQ